MELGKVTARVRVERAIPALEEKRLFAVATERGTTVAADLVGATEERRVVLLTGEAARICCMNLPVDAVIVAIAQESY